MEQNKSIEKKEQKSFKIEGMHCASCSVLIEKSLSRTKGVHSVSVNLATETGKIEYDSSVLSFGDVEKKIKDLGYEVVSEKRKDGSRKYLLRFIVALILSIPVSFSMIFDINKLPFSYLNFYNLLVVFFGILVVLGAGSNFHISFFLKLQKLQFNMDSLISLGSLTALIYSIWALIAGNPFHHFIEGANFIITFILLGKYLEARSKGKASEALQKLFKLQVKKATVIREGKEEEVEIDSVETGEILMIKTGEKIPLDGIILEGSANIDESMLTGESLPVFKTVSAEVFAATFVLDGILKVKVTKKQSETMFSKIVVMVEEAQNKKAPIQHLADKVAGIFVPVIISISFLTFIIWFLASGGNISESLLPAVAVLVIACPCALGLATPTAIIVATGSGAQHGIIIKDGEAFEKSSKIDSVIFDKTGTLTKGRPEVTDIHPILIKRDRLLSYAVSLAKNSNHPLSQAIRALIEDKDKDKNKKDKDKDKDMDSLNYKEIKDFKEIPGKGVEGYSVLSKVIVRLGNYKLMTENNIKWDSEISEWIERLSSEGKSVLFLALDNKLAGIFGIMDMPKPDASEAISELVLMGKEVYMISGDNRGTAMSIAKSLGIDADNVIAEVLPHEKAAHVIEIQKRGKKVAFVGDGINDAPALAVADLGIAIGTGSDIAIETGNIVLVRGDPSRLVTALKLSARTYKIIKQNLFWAFFYNLTGVPLAAFGALPPAFASLAMSLSSISVVTNSLRIKKKN